MTDLTRLKAEIRTDGFSDPFATCMSWLFAVAEVIHFEREIDVPPEWQYRPSPVQTEPEPDRLEVDLLRDEDDETVLALGRLLYRWSRLIEARGDSY